jgi:hypothetical protein
MKYIYRFLILASVSLINLSAENFIEFDLDNDPRFHVELNLSDEFEIWTIYGNSLIFGTKNDRGPAGGITFEKNTAENTFLKKWSSIVEHAESFFPRKYLIDSPTIALPLREDTLARHSLLCPVSENHSYISVEILIETESYVCHLFLTPDQRSFEQVQTLCQNIANNLHLIFLDKTIYKPFVANH